MTIGQRVLRWRWGLVAIWAGAAAAFMLLVPQPPPMAGLTTDMLPADSPFNQAVAQMARYFPDKSSVSQAAVVLERPDGLLTDADRAYAEQIAEAIADPRRGGLPAEVRSRLTVRSPGALAIMGKANPLRSSDGRATIVSVNLPYSHASTQAVQIVNDIHAALGERARPPGLSAAVTGSAAYGRDYIVATERSHDRIVVLTIVVIVVILLAVYRAPLAAIVPLVGIGLAAALTTKLMIAGRVLGLGSGTAERLFMLVLLFGAGVDYSMLFISRYREFIGALHPPRDAFVRALDASFGAIVCSAAATAGGLATLCFVRFGLFRDVGPAIVLALVVAAAASVTVVPALVVIIGPRVFWPARPGQSAVSGQAAGGASVIGWLERMRDRTWPAVAAFVTRRPVLVLLATFIALAMPATRGGRLTWVYDAQGSLTGTYDAVRGIAMVERHWPAGETAPLTVLATAEARHTSTRWTSACARIVAAIRGIAGVAEVRSLSTPLGLHADPSRLAALKSMAGNRRLRREFISADGRATWLSVVLKSGPQTPSSLAAAVQIHAAAQQALSQEGIQARIHLTGPTAETLDLREVSQEDFRRTAIGAMAVIFLIVLVLLRDVLLSAFMVAATVLGYVATLGLTYWTFAAFGQHGLGWEVQVFLYIVMVAVGQDYNIFFAVRLAQEGERLAPVQATEQALIHTGRVISSCGLIMAATLGSMMAGDVRMLRQLGFALALGMLIDTFIIRPLLLPSFIVLTRRNLAKAAAFIRKAHPGG
jgi:RND superfamily putative drug exporter